MIEVSDQIYDYSLVHRTADMSVVSDFYDGVTYHHGNTGTVKSPVSAAFDVYKKKVLKKLKQKKMSDISVTSSQEYVISYKYDGEPELLYYDSKLGTLICNSPKSRGRFGLGVTVEMEQILSELGFQHAEIVGELYYPDEDGNPYTSIGDTLHAATGKVPSEVDSLRFAIFGILSLCRDHTGVSECPHCISYTTGIDGREVPYKEVIAKIDELFSGYKYVHPIKHVIGDASHIQKSYMSWVSGTKAEGIVARESGTQSKGLKIKPSLSVDAVVLGFCRGELGGRQERLGNVLVGVLDGSGDIRVLSAVGGGYKHKEQKGYNGPLLNELAEMLEKRVLYIHDGSQYQTDIGWNPTAEYMETYGHFAGTPRPAAILDSADGRFQPSKMNAIGEYYFVVPDIVFEVKFESTYEAERECLKWDPTTKEYTVIGNKPAVSLRYPEFIRVRDDKGFNVTDIRLSQFPEFQGQ